MSEPLSHARLVERLSYDPKTGHFTHAQSRPGVVKGRRAGSSHATGYRRITVFGRTYLEHRLAWFWMTGVWPEVEVDHKNGKRSDNRWRNLRAATSGQNKRNTPGRNATGLKGVQPRGGRFQAVITRGGKRQCLGSYATPEIAHAVYAKAARAQHGGFHRV